MSPFAAVVEQVASRWLKELFGLPDRWSIGFPTGAQMANFTALLVARRYLLQREGWNVDSAGLFGAPEIEVIVGDEAHRTIFSSLRMLGLGDGRVRRVETDDQGRLRADRLAQALQLGSAPRIVCAQLGNVNTGASDPLNEIVALTRASRAWLHVDGAFGLWAAASQSLKHLTSGIAEVDSIATDAHKWLNVPYDCGIVLTAHPEAHSQALTVAAHYIQMSEGERNPRAFTPDESRRARSVPVYATLRALGRGGVADMVERCCLNARRMAAALERHPQVRILNQVVLNQVLVQFLPRQDDPRDASAFTDYVVNCVQKEGTCWLGATEWHGRRAARISISHWATNIDDIDRSAGAILGVLDAAR